MFGNRLGVSSTYGCETDYTAGVAPAQNLSEIITLTACLSFRLLAQTPSGNDRPDSPYRDVCLPSPDRDVGRSERVRRKK